MCVQPLQQALQIVTYLLNLPTQNLVDLTLRNNRDYFSRVLLVKMQDVE